ncbi:hypothetical protein As57867_006165, partial [Aphanomyces stellatus]
MRLPALSCAFAVVTAATVDDFLQVLPDAPRGYGQPCSNRVYWQPILAANPSLVTKTRNEGLASLKMDMPAWSETDYLLFSKTGNRDVGQAMMTNRHNYAKSLVLAECFAMDGSFLAKAEAALVSYAT